MRQLFQSDFQHEPDKQAGWIGKVGREFSLLLDQMTLKCCSKTRFLLRSKRLILRKEYKEYSNPIKKATTKGKGTTKQNHNQKKKRIATKTWTNIAQDKHSTHNRGMPMN